MIAVVGTGTVIGVAVPVLPSVFSRASTIVTVTVVTVAVVTVAVIAITVVTIPVITVTVVAVAVVTVVVVTVAVVAAIAVVASIAAIIAKTCITVVATGWGEGTGTTAVTHVSASPISTVPVEIKAISGWPFSL